MAHVSPARAQYHKRAGDRPIDFNTIQIENFSNFYALGLASSNADLTLFQNRLKAIPACEDFSIVSKSAEARTWEK